MMRTFSAWWLEWKPEGLQDQIRVQLDIARPVTPEAQGSVDTLRGHHLLGGVQRDVLLPGAPGDLDARLNQPPAHASSPGPRVHGKQPDVGLAGLQALSPFDRPVELDSGRADDALAGDGDEDCGEYSAAADISDVAKVLVPQRVARPRVLGVSALSQAAGILVFFRKHCSDLDLIHRLSASHPGRHAVGSQADKIPSYGRLEYGRLPQPEPSRTAARWAFSPSFSRHLE